MQTAIHSHYSFVRYEFNYNTLHQQSQYHLQQRLSCNMVYSHTFLIDNHVGLHSSQNASYTEDVCDMHLKLTAKPHLCVICSTFHT